MDAATATMVRNLEEKTGRSLDAWIGLARNSGLEKHGEIVKWLKTECGITHGYANLIAITARNGLNASRASTEDLEAGIFSGTKSDLRPIYDLLRAAVVAFGRDVEIAPKKAYVSFRRKKQFALMQPSTATRLDVGLNLKGVELFGRLEPSGSFSAMCTHRVRIVSAEDVDAEVIGWLGEAYSQAG